MNNGLARFEIQTIYNSGRIVSEYIVAEDTEKMVEKYKKHHDMDKVESYSEIGRKYHVKKEDKFYGKKTIK